MKKHLLLILLSSLFIIDCNAQLPVAGFVASDTTVCPGECINFTNTSLNAVSYQWNFRGGDFINGTDTMTNPQFVCYDTSGTMDVTLIATDSLGRSDTLTISNYITVYPQPLTPSVTCHGDTSWASPGYTTYQWYYGSDTIPGATNDMLIHPAPGNYNLVVTDTNGCAVGVGTIGWWSCPAALFYTYDTSICAGNCIYFYNASQEETSVEWTFTGGIPSSSTLANPGCIYYNVPGDYDVTLIASDGFGSDSITFPNYIHVSSCTSVPEYFSSSLQLYLSSNPVSDFFYLHLSSKEKTIASVVIKNLLGQEMGVHHSEIRNPNSGIKIDCGEFPAGIYFVRVMTEDGEVSAKFVVYK